MFDDRQVRPGQDGLANLNDIMITTRAVDPPVPCKVRAHAMVPFATVGWGRSCAMFIRANGVDADAILEALLIDEGVTNQGVHLARVSTTLVNTKREPVWDVTGPVPFKALTDLPEGYKPLL
jgi:hypothetical protein